MKVKATKKFYMLGIEDSYHGLSVDDYYKLRAGKIVELKEIPQSLINYVEKIKEKNHGN